MPPRTRAARSTGPRIRLIHWVPGEARARAAQLRRTGYRVEHGGFGPQLLKTLGRTPPDAIVIDLSRLPITGRDVGVALRSTKATRHVPVVFVEGDPERVAKVRAQLPDAVYTTWNAIVSPLKRAIAEPLSSPLVPASRLAGYSGTPLPRKLGIKPGWVVALLGAPDRFAETLGALPERVTLRAGARGRCDQAIWFVRSARELRQGIERVGRFPGEGGLWIAWVKQASQLRTDVTEAMVREAGLANGLVDFKICAIDGDWSGLRFARRGTR
ncbi:MAG TPA: hypothetical protein VLT17_10625 [Gemmatimonadales bacterium]|jgi:CheY-like chemotaxis protein|nr:hypothetical protein [Gemmatimonadales bacterium]